MSEKKEMKSHLQAVRAGVEIAGGTKPAPSSDTSCDPEVVAHPVRRRFSAEFKRQVLEEADACAGGDGEIGAVLRRHGLYWSHLVTWRRQRKEGTLAGLAPKKRGRKPTPKNPLAATVAKLQRENAKLTARAERAERLVELQKKVSELLGIALPSPDDEKGGKR